MNVQPNTNLINGEMNGVQRDADVLIIGAGVVGCLTAIKLGQAGIKVQIIEALPDVSNAPRACGYFGAVQNVLDELGLYKLIRKQGFMTRGLCWRSMPKDDPKTGGKRYGDMIAALPLCEPNETEFPVGAGVVNLTQAQLNKLFLAEAMRTGNVKVDFDTELSSIKENTQSEVKIRALNGPSGDEKYYNARYCIGADGSHSVLRKALGLSFPGHTWPERLLATNVRIPNIIDPIWHIHYFMKDKNWGVGTPLEEPVIGQSTLWRWAMAIDSNDLRSDEELLSDQNIQKLYEENMPGPRPLQAKIEARVIYKIHQRLAPTLRKGNCLLAGDAAHVCNPIGAMGLNTGMLDADALAEALIMVLKEGRSDRILNVYSDERRKVFQFFVDPTTTQNKIRLHTYSPETAAEDDWFLRALANPIPEQMQELGEKYFTVWRTDIRNAAQEIQ